MAALGIRMTEFEYIEAAMTQVNYMSWAAMDVVTVFFAYCVAAYLVGKQLKALVAVTATVIYTLFLLNPLIGMLTAVTSYRRLMDAGYRLFPDSSYFVAEPGNEIFMILMVVVPTVLAWFSSVIYMHVIQRAEQANA